MSDLLAITGARIFDSATWHDDAALLIEFGYVAGIVPASEIPANAERVTLDGGMIVPGFIDLQVNGGGGILSTTTPRSAPSAPSAPPTPSSAPRHSCRR